MVEGATAPLERPARRVPDLPAGEQAEERLRSVAAQVAACRRCSLHLSRTNPVPGSGPATARLMAVGEAPGEREDREGVPFVGAAGQLLTRLLEGIGLSRADIFITNVLKSRPPGNRDPLPEEVAACAPFLDAQIDIIRPQVIILLGRHALQRLLPGAPGISRCHGQVLQVADRSYMPCYHPAAGLYNGSMLPALEDDFQKLRRYLDSLPQRQLRAPEPPPAEQLGLF